MRGRKRERESQTAVKHNQDHEEDIFTTCLEVCLGERRTGRSQLYNSIPHQIQEPLGAVTGQS